MMFTMMGLSAPAGRDDKPRLELYGPLGLRAHLRTTLATCYATLSSNYVVHELLWPGQPAYPHDIPRDAPPVFRYVEGDQALPEHVRGQERILPLMPPHPNELPGRNIRMDEATCTWPEIGTIAHTGITVSAAPITHRCPTLGYVLTEPLSASQSISPRDLAQLDSNTEALFESQGIRNPRVLLSGLLRSREPLHLPDGSVLHPPPWIGRGASCASSATRATPRLIWSPSTTAGRSARGAACSTSRATQTCSFTSVPMPR